MLNENTDPALAARCERVSLGCALAVAGLGVTVLIGWALGVATLTNGFVGSATMNPNTALGYVLGGIALIAALRVRKAPGWRVVHLGLAGALTLLGLLSVGEYLIGADFGIDGFLPTAAAGLGSGAWPSKMSLATATGFAFTGLALLSIDGRMRIASFAAALVGTLIGVLALMGYAFGVAALYSVDAYSNMTLHTAGGLVAINLGILHARPLRRPIAVLTSSTTGGVMARRLFPLALTAPFLIGWLYVRGKLGGLYESPFEVALISLTYVVLFAAIIWHTAEELRHADERRLAAERGRSRQQAQLTGIIESAMDAIVMLDATHRIVLFNPAAERMFGRSAAEMLGTPLDGLMPQRFRSNHAGHVRAFDNAGTSSCSCVSGTVRGLRANGEEFPIEASIFRVEVNGEHYLTSILRDITARRDAELATQAARAQAERANNAKSRFLAAASHDLRQPLSALALYVTVLDGKLAPEDRPVLANMKSCVGSLSALLTDLLDLSKLEAGVVRPNCCTFPVADVLANDLSVHAPEAERKGVRLHCRPSSWIAQTDRVLFKRILGNLVDNAVRYTDRGGVLVACRRRQGKAWVEVWDTGIGIAADKTPEIFEEFRQLGDDARTRGSGLGLAIVAKTAALLGLEIRVHSRPGRGSVFAIELPLGQAPLPPALESDVVACRPLTIALVEDNTLVREALTSALRNAGHRVFAASTGAELCVVLGGATPDVVVSDYRLAQGETGFDVITAARAAVANADLPAIIITGDTDPTLMRSMADRGIAVLHKPIDLETLQAHLEDLTCAPGSPNRARDIERLFPT
jgi:PAS domain S-box-containing protein